MRAWRRLVPRHGATPARTYCGSSKKLEKYGMLAGVADCGRSQKRGRRGRFTSRFKPRCGRVGTTWFAGLTLWFWGSLNHSLGSRKARCSSDAELSLSSLEEGRRVVAGRKGVKGLSLVGPEKVPRGFGLRTGGQGNTADSVGNCRIPPNRACITGKNRGPPEPQASISSPEIRYPGPGKAGKEGRTVCVCGCFKGLWDFNKDIKSLL